LLIIETTLPNSKLEFAHKSRHLTPELLGEELKSFKKRKRYLPRVLIVHMDPTAERDIASELDRVASELGCDISIAHEGSRYEL
jgi:hypothetical protein